MRQSSARQIHGRQEKCLKINVFYVSITCISLSTPSPRQRLRRLISIVTKWKMIIVWLKCILHAFSCSQITAEDSRAAQQAIHIASTYTHTPTKACMQQSAALTKLQHIAARWKGQWTWKLTKVRRSSSLTAHTHIQAYKYFPTAWLQVMQHILWNFVTFGRLAGFSHARGKFVLLAPQLSGRALSVMHGSTHTYTNNYNDYKYIYCCCCCCCTLNVIGLLIFSVEYFPKICLKLYFHFLGTLHSTKLTKVRKARWAR